jgi:hypothetical protein
LKDAFLLSVDAADVLLDELVMGGFVCDFEGFGLGGLRGEANWLLSYPCLCSLESRREMMKGRLYWLRSESKT